MELIEQLSNLSNAFPGTLKVDVHSTDLRIFVLIHDGPWNQGMSITNAAETYCPQICQRLGLDWGKCVFIESYEKYDRGYDATYDRIRFRGPVDDRISLVGPLRGQSLPYAPLWEPGWAPLDWHLADGLASAGYLPSVLLNKQVMIDDDNVEPNTLARIHGYNGRLYKTDAGIFRPSQIIAADYS